MLHILGDGVIEIDHCSDGILPNPAHRASILGSSLPAGKIGGPFMPASPCRYTIFDALVGPKRSMSDPAL